MSPGGDELPPKVARLRLKNWPHPLTKAPHGQIDGCDFWHLNTDKVDVFESATRARALLHPALLTTPDSDRRYEDMLVWRANREAAEKLKKEKGES